MPNRADRKRSTFGLHAFRISTKISKGYRMGFPWPVTEDELVLDDALDIAMRYFDLPHDEEEYGGLQSFAAEAIMEDWRRGVRNKVVLANKAIAEIEEHHPLRNELRRAS